MTNTLKHLTCAVVCFFLFISLCKAQESKGYIGISLGPSFPIGEFASKNYGYFSSGMAKTGSLFDISFTHKLGKGNFGVSGLMRGQAYPIDLVTITRDFAIEIPGNKWIVESDGWSLSSFMAGAYGSIPVSEKVGFEPKIMIGFMAARSPNLNVTGNNSGNETWLRQGSLTAGSFAYFLGAGFRFDIGKRIYLLSQLDLIGANPQFSRVETVFSNGKRYYDSWTQPIRSVNLSLGVALKI